MEFRIAKKQTCWGLRCQVVTELCPPAPLACGEKVAGPVWALRAEKFDSLARAGLYSRGQGWG